MNPTRTIMLIMLSVLSFGLQAQQDSTPLATAIDPVRYATAISEKIAAVDKKLSKQTTKVLKKFEKQEAKILKLLAKKDSTQTKEALINSSEKLAQLQTEFTNMPGKAVAKFTGNYNAYIDTLKTSLKFLIQKQETLAGSSKQISDKLQQATSKLNILDGKLQQASDIKKYLRDRKDILKQQLEKYGLVKELKKIEKATYYYGTYVKEYKEILSDRKKLERKAVALLYATPVFKKFVSENSILAGLFKMPGSNSVNNVSIPTLAGIQTRENATALMQTSVATGGPNAMAMVRQQVQAAQAQLSVLKDKITKYGSQDADIPSFKPNGQRTKGFLQRLEYGANIQFGKANKFLPASSDIAVSLGYKINDKSSAGIGLSYKAGLGTGWNNIKLTHQGVGLRSYIDWKMKGNLYLSAGYEQNYNSSFKNISQLKQYAAWQSTGLIGISKKLKLNGGRSSKISVMYDLLWNAHVPVTQPFVFRTGLNFK